MCNTFYANYTSMRTCLICTTHITRKPSEPKLAAVHSCRKRVTSMSVSKNAANRKSKINDFRSTWLWSDKVQPYVHVLSVKCFKCFNTLNHIIVGETFLNPLIEHQSWLVKPRNFICIQNVTGQQTLV